MKFLRLNEKLETMLICAERYALGRRTYITGMTADYLIGLLPDFTQNTLTVILRDLAEARAAERRCTDYRPFGDACDRAEWMKLAAAIGGELERRKARELCSADERELLEEAARF